MNRHLRRFPVAALVLPAVLACGAAPARAVDLLKENFDQLALNPVTTFQSEVRSRQAWTNQPPSGAGVTGTWTVDNSLMPATAIDSDLIGVAEFEGWTFVDRDWWIDSSGDQDRRQFVSASGTIAVADPDEWDDFGSPSPASTGNFDSTLRISAIPLLGIAPNTGRLFFHSSWRWEGNQKASLTVKYNDPAATVVPLLQWTSLEGDPNFHPDATNEAIDLPIQNPAGATSATLEFRLYDSRNNWWWAIDNLSMFTGAAPAQDGALRLVINRDTQEVRIVNNTSAAVNLRGYSIESRGGALDEAAANFLGESNPNWIVLNNPLTAELSEGYIPGQYVMPTATSNPALGQIDLGAAWQKYHEDISDITFQYLVAGKDAPVTGIIEFVGNGGASFDPLDLNFDGAINMGDYAAFLAGYNTPLAGKTAAQQYTLGDLDADGQHTVQDFLTFKRRFDGVRGPGAFAAALAAGGLVPEPAGTALAVMAVGCVVALSRRRRLAPAASIAAMAFVAAAGSAHASLPLLVENFDGVTLGQSPEEQPAQTAVWNGTGPTGWTIDSTGVPGYTSGDPTMDAMRDWAGWAVVNKDWWVTAAGDQRRSMFTLSTGNVLVADPDEWDDAAHPNTGYYNTFIKTPVINIPAGIPAGKIRLAFDSSWRPEATDDWAIPPATAPTNNQTGAVGVSYNGGAFANVLTWDSIASSPTFHADGPSDAGPPASENESVELDLNYNGTATTLQVQFGLTKAANDWWWAIDNVRIVVPAEPTILQINTATGFASLVGGDVISETINGYDISSVNGNLAPLGNLGLSFSKPDSIDGPDADSIVGNNINETWQLGSANANLFSEFFLDGSSSFTDARTDSLGRIFNPATPAENRDVQFTYTTTFGDVVTGVVQYVSTPANADFDGNGVVDGLDFLRWQRGVGAGTTLGQGDADADGDVDGADLAIWKGQFGSAAATAAAQVPEPTALSLATLVAAAAARVPRRKRRIERAALAAVGGLAVAIVAADRAAAQVIPPPFVDRDYRMGDNDPGAANGATVSVTRDNAGALGMNQLIDMTSQTRGGGSPTYVTISSRPDGGTGLGIRLNPNPADRQYLRTGADEALNFPERSPSSTEGTLPGGTLDYLYVTDRGFQLWVQPIAASEAHIVMDSNNHGALVTPEGKFGMRYAGFDYAGVTSVVPNTWYHLMVVRAFGDRGSGSVLYVNGVAEAAATGIYNGEDAPNDETNPVNHDNSPLVIGSTTSESPFQVGTLRHFRGIVDDLTMFVMGLNNTADYGEFSFQRDNAYAAAFAPTTAGDLPATPGGTDYDHVITMADVTMFAANWRKENRLTWTQGGAQRSLVVGDLHSRAMGDFNYDGRIDLADWGILNAVNPAMGAVAMQLIQAIPEPSALALAAAAGAIAVHVCRDRRRRRKSSAEMRNA